MKKILLFQFILFFVTADAQDNYSEFPETGFGIILPDTGFVLKQRKFYNSQSGASIMMIDRLTSGVDNIPYPLFMQMMMKEILSPGVTLLSDKFVSADSNRLIKTKIDFDITDMKPATKGRKDIIWLYFYNYRQRPVLLIASYPLESDKIVGEKIVRSLVSLKSIDNAAAASLFKNRISITDDYAPLKYCGPSFGGIRLNMEGQYEIKGNDSSYCLIVPITVNLSIRDADSMRSYMLTRMQIHVNSDVDVQKWSVSISQNSKMYRMTGSTRGGKLLYLCIKSDEKGYFEIWGNAYRNNKELITVFERISESLVRN